MAPTSAELKSIFNNFDMDSSGAISKEELQAALEKGGKSVTEEEVDEILLQVDTDDDKEISFEEFQEIFKLAPDAMPRGLKQIYDVSGYFLSGIRGLGSRVYSLGSSSYGLVMSMVSSSSPESEAFDISDTNVENIGSEEDKAARKAAAETEEAWEGAGASAGTRVWRVEQFKIVAWPEERYGQFYDGDSYIVLHTYLEKESDKLLHDIYFWLGEKTSQDEMGTAAYKTVELDDLMDGEPVQHREVMKFESAGFKALFPTLTYLSGGIASGFNRDEPGAYIAKLLLVKKLNKKTTIAEVPFASASFIRAPQLYLTNMRLHHAHISDTAHSRLAHAHLTHARRLGQVPCTRASLNDGDSFVLDAGEKVYVWNGDNASPFEKLAANLAAENLESQRAGSAKATTNLDDEFWAKLGGEGPVASKEDAGEVLPTVPPVGEGVLFQLSDTTGSLEINEVGRGDLTMDMLNSSDVFIVDPGPELLVWLGSEASERERAASFNTASKYLRSVGKPMKTPVAVLKEGQEGRNDLFNKIFA